MTDDTVTTNLLNDPHHICVGKGEGLPCFDEKATLDVLLQMPLPGIVIFVHGVNSDGEWYTDSEQGLCAGLNERLKRCDEHMAHPTPAGGQLTPAAYLPELTPAGFINPKLSFNSFITGNDNFTPVIHFRWGYTASSEELQQFGNGIYLNENDYWGGGPFANGCTSLPDMWGKGLSDNLFLWLHVQHLNPTNDRNVYSCPPRPYYVLAALRLARLVESIRKKQADVPITIVCHSQGNMIGIAAAFLGDKLAPAKDASGASGRCVADTYVLCNAPYSLVASNFADDWSEGEMKDKQGNTGRQTGAARSKTLAAFFQIVHKQTAVQMDPAHVDMFMANEAHGHTAQADRKSHGINGSTYGRVTLYCNPHDQVISSTTVQGIGWRGMNAEEIKATGGTGIFTQRVFAHGFKVGEAGDYKYWGNHYRKPAPGSQSFWFPESPKAEYSLSKGMEASKGWGKVWTVLMAPLTIVAMKLVGMRINALPDKGWTIPLNAPNLPKSFFPESKRFGVCSDKFDQGYDAPGQGRNKEGERKDGDPYAGNRPIPKGGSEGQREASDAAMGNESSEASLRYEDHARLRMQAKREGKYKNDQKVTEEDSPETASPGYKTWHDKQIKTNLAANIDTHATDHSTIMTNGMHAQLALAYDVAIGCCHIPSEDLHMLRTTADWRFLKGLDDGDANKAFLEYFLYGKFKERTVYDWAQKGEGAMPESITDERQHAAPKVRSNEGVNP